MIGTIEYNGCTVECFSANVVIDCLDGNGSLIDAFIWITTPQGDSFWDREDDKAPSYSQTAREALIEMLYLWNEQHPEDAVPMPWMRP